MVKGVLTLRRIQSIGDHCEISYCYRQTDIQTDRQTNRQTTTQECVVFANVSSVKLTCKNPRKPQPMHRLRSTCSLPIISLANCRLNENALAPRWSVPSVVVFTGMTTHDDHEYYSVSCDCLQGQIPLNEATVSSGAIRESQEQYRMPNEWVLQRGCLLFAETRTHPGRA